MIDYKDKKIEKIIVAKNQRISAINNNKDESIRLSSIRRDAALFASLNWQEYSGATKADMIKAALAYWLNYFSEEIYKSPVRLEEEAVKEDHKHTAEYMEKLEAKNRAREVGEGEKLSAI